MGHLVNPIAIRLSINNLWNSNWVLINNFNYNTMFKKDYLLFQYLNWFIKKKHMLFHNFIISHYKLYKIHDKIFINLYYYTADMEEEKYYIHNRIIMSIIWKKYKRSLWKYKNNKSKLSYPSNFKFLYNKHYKRNSNKFRRIHKYFCKFVISYLFYYCINIYLNYYLNKLNNITKYTKTWNNELKYYFNVFNLDFWNVTPNIITTYISCKLQQRYSLNWVLKPIFKDLTKKMNKGYFLGYKLLCAGRFTRRQIATYIWIKKGSLCLNNFSSLVKYSQARIRLKFGLGGIKLWLHYGYNNKLVKPRLALLVYPKYTPFKFFFEKKKKTVIFFFNYWAFVYLRIIFLKKSYLYKYEGYIKLKINNFFLYIETLIKKSYYSKINRYNLKFISDNKIIINLNNNNFLKENKYLKIRNKNLFKKFYE